MAFLALALLALSTFLQSGRASGVDRIDCYPELDHNEDGCVARQCIWEHGATGDPEGIPTCYMQTALIGYTGTVDGDSVLLTKNNGPTNPWGEDTPTIRFLTSDLGNGVLNIRIGTDQARFDPSSLLNFPRETVPSTSSFTVSTDLSSDPFSFVVARTEDGTKLFDTSIGGLIFSDKFIQIVAKIPTDAMYGWGENVHLSFKHDFTRYSAWGMFAKGTSPSSSSYDTKDLYGVHPFYMLLEPSGKAHGVLFLNTNAQDLYTIPLPAFAYRTIGGSLDMYFFPGPTPSDVIRQYHAFIGKPIMPPYWSLGYQLCRWGYSNLDDLKSRVSAVQSYNIPFDVVQVDIDYMQNAKVFTVDETKWSGFGDYLAQLKKQGMSNILIFEPHLEVDYDPYTRAIEANISFVEWETADQVPHDVQDHYALAKDTLQMLGKVRPTNNVAFVDFLDTTAKTDEWWKHEFKLFHDTVPFDGAWIDMNEPSVSGTYHSDTSDGSSNLRCPVTGPYAEWDNPPYQTAAVYDYGANCFLADHTICMNGLTARRTQRVYDTKDLYGWSEGRATKAAVEYATGRRAAVVGRSTYPSSGRYSGHWLGDNNSKWEDLQTTIIAVMEFNMFGIPYVGSDVCGFNGATTEELCLRWQQLGAFHSFFRNHNSEGQPAQDPAVWPTVAAASKKANEFRYAYLPYLYHLHYRASVYGETVIRPLFFEFPNDTTTYTLNYQFMWGANVLVAPVTQEGQTSVDAYIPSDDFYSLYDYNYGQLVPKGTSSFSAPTTYNLPTFVRAGSFLPRHQTAATTVPALRLIPFSFLIVPTTAAGSASGEMIWDDGISIIYGWETLDFGLLSLAYSTSGTQSTATFVTEKPTTNSINVAQLEIFNYPSSPDYSSFTLNGRALSVNTQSSSYSAISKVLTVVFTSNVNIAPKGIYCISWHN